MTLGVELEIRIVRRGPRLPNSPDSFEGFAFAHQLLWSCSSYKLFMSTLKR